MNRLNISKPITDFGLGPTFDPLWTGFVNMERGELMRLTQQLAGRNPEEKRLLRDIISEELCPHAESELINSFLKECSIVFDAEAQRPLKYALGVYVPLEDTDIDLLVAEMISRIPYIKKPAGQPKRLRNKIGTLLRACPSVLVNRVEGILNLRNGLLEIDHSILTEHMASHYATIQLSIEYDKEAICPEWEKALTAYLNPTDRRELQKLFYYIISGKREAQKLFVFYGSGANGKTTTCRVLEELIGSQTVSHMTVEDLSRNQFNLAHLHGKLLNISGEVGRKHTLRDELLKQLTGEDLITAQQKYRDPISWENTARLVVLSNHIIQTRDQSHGFYRRLKFFRFNSLDSRIGGFFESHLRKEMSGILNWALKGKSLYERDGGFRETESDRLLIREMQRQSDSVLVFWEERNIEDYIQEQPRRKRKYLETDTLFPIFDDWRSSRRMPSMNSEHFRAGTAQYLESHTKFELRGIESIYLPSQKRQGRAIVLK